MELTTALLADAAVVAEGKLYVHGGLWNELRAEAFPVVHPTMAVVLSLRVEYHEALDAHNIDVRLMKDGMAIGPAAQARLHTGHPPEVTLGAPIFVPLTLTFPMVTFPEAGRYEWAVTIDGDTAGTCQWRSGR